MSDELIRQRKERLSPEAQSLYDFIVGAAHCDDKPSVGGPKFKEIIERMAALPDSERRKLVDVMEMTGFGMQQRIKENEEAVDTLKGVREVFRRAHEKLRSEGKPIDPDMTVREAYEVLGLAPPE